MYALTPYVDHTLRADDVKENIRSAINQYENGTCPLDYFCCPLTHGFGGRTSDGSLLLMILKSLDDKQGHRRSISVALKSAIDSMPMNQVILTPSGTFVPVAFTQARSRSKSRTSTYKLHATTVVGSSEVRVPLGEIYVENDSGNKSPHHDLCQWKITNSVGLADHLSLIDMFAQLEKQFHIAREFIDASKLCRELLDAVRVACVHVRRKHGSSVVPRVERSKLNCDKHGLRFMQAALICMTAGLPSVNARTPHLLRETAERNGLSSINVEFMYNIHDIEHFSDTVEMLASSLVSNHYLLLDAKALDVTKSSLSETARHKTTTNQMANELEMNKHDATKAIANLNSLAQQLRDAMESVEHVSDCIATISNVSSAFDDIMQ